MGSAASFLRVVDDDEEVLLVRGHHDLVLPGTEAHEGQVVVGVSLLKKGGQKISQVSGGLVCC